MGEEDWNGKEPLQESEESSNKFGAGLKDRVDTAEMLCLLSFVIWK